ncbi:MAG: DUF3883 domain-containing protein [Anaerolineae bacterium]
MLEELLKYDRLASKDELLFLLFKALSLSESQKLSDLKRYCTSNHFSIGRSFDGTIKLLEFMGFIDVFDDIVSINKQLFDPAKIKHQEAYLEQDVFIQHLFASLRRENRLADFIKPDALRRDSAKGLFYVKESLIPLRFFGIRNLLISLEFFGRDLAFKSNNLFVNPNSTKLFETLVVDSLRDQNQQRKRRFLLSELKAKLDRQEDLGEEAEIFVLDFEKKRLEGHSTVERIQRVSENYVNAGFDIESFNDIESVFVDRFIEVKSYSGIVIFYWSRNEIETAKELADKYFLYLVDRSKISQPSYLPKIFQNPYQKIFENEFWKKESEVWKISASQEKEK